MKNRMPKKKLFTLIILLALVFAAAAALFSARLIHNYLNPDFSAMTIDEIRAFSEKRGMACSISQEWNNSPAGEILRIEKKDKEIEIITSLGPETEKTVITLAAAGDVLTHEPVLEAARTADGYDFISVFSAIKPIVQKADLAFVNQEVMITVPGELPAGGTSYGKIGPLLRAPTQLMAALANTGFDLVSGSNNHSFDFGKEGAAYNYTAWKNFPAVRYNGTHADAGSGPEVCYLSVSGIRISFVAYTQFLNESFPPTDAAKEAVNVWDYRQIGNTVKEAKTRSDLLIFSLHSGTEFTLDEVPFQRNLFRFIADAGADIILGHHPHVLEPAEWLAGENGNKTFVIYSLGNFLNSVIYRKNAEWQKIGGLLYLDLVKYRNREEVSYFVENPRFLPTKTYYDKSKPAGYRVAVLDSEDAEKFRPGLEKILQKYIPDLEILSSGF